MQIYIQIGTNIADLKDQLVEFKPLSNGYHRIKLVYHDLYFIKTSESTYGWNNFKWLEATGGTYQLWVAEEYISYHIYPYQTMRIAQLHNGSDSHYPNSTDNP